MWSGGLESPFERAIRRVGFARMLKPLDGQTRDDQQAETSVGNCIVARQFQILWIKKVLFLEKNYQK